MATQDGIFAGLMEGDELERFFERFVASDSAPFLPRRSVGEVLEDARAIWEKQGFLTPAKLEYALIETYLPHAPREVLSTIRDIEYSRDKPEPTMGLLGKEHAYLLRGLGHLYQRETGATVIMFTADYSCMDGTNRHNTARLREENGLAPDERTPMQAVLEKQGREMTDAAMRLLARGMIAGFQRAIPEASHVIGCREGGDEVGGLVIIPPDAARAADPPLDAARLKDVLDLQHIDGEMHVAALGLQDHRHPKYPANRLRDGFGYALAVKNMAEIDNPAAVSEEMDAHVKIAKRQIGFIRHIDNPAAAGTPEYEAEYRRFAEYTRMETERRLELGLADGAPAGMTPEQKKEYVDRQVETALEHARLASESMRKMNPMHNPELDGGTASYRAYIREQLGMLGEEKPGHAKVPLVLSHMDAAYGSMRPDDVAPLGSMHERRMALVLGNLRDFQGARLDAAQEYFLGLSVRGLAPRDPSAQAALPQAMLETAEVFAEETAEYQNQIDARDPAVKAALARAGLDSLSAALPQAIAVSCHGLAAVNDLLGRCNADIVLRHITHEVIGGALRDAGAPAGSFAVAHHGGMNYTAIARAGARGEDGAPVFISGKTMRVVERGIQERMEKLRRTPVTDFLEARGGEIAPASAAALAQNGITTFADLPDAKEREAEVAGRTVTGGMPGVHAVTVVRPVAPWTPGAPMRGGPFIEALRTTADAKMEALRGAFLRKQYLRSDEMREDVRRRLPDALADAMPPEVQSLVVLRRPGAEAKFRAQYESLVDMGSLDTVMDYLESQAGKQGLAARFGRQAVRPAASRPAPSLPAPGKPQV